MPDFAVRTAFTAVDKISPAFRNMESSASSFQKTASRAFMAVGTFVTGYLVKSFVDAAAQTERLKTSFNSVFGSDAANQMRFVREETNRLGIDMMSSAEAYKGIAAAAKGTAITNRDVQQTFLGVSEAAAALQLTSEQSQGALLAISQIISKGKVSMEELRGQLGERIPGAMQIAARSMGVTTAELEKLVASGIPAEKFIPRFAAQMRKEFGPAALESANSFNALSNKFNNSTFEMKAAIGETLLPALIDLFAAFQPIVGGMRDFFRENKEGISTLMGLVPWLVGGFLAWKGILWGIFGAQMAIKGIKYVEELSKIADMMIISGSEGSKYILMLKQTAIYQKAAAKATGIMTAAQAAFNYVASMNPYILIGLAIAALIGYVVVAIKNWDDFGAAMMLLLGPLGLLISQIMTLKKHWEEIKQAFTSDGIIAGLQAIGNAMKESILFPLIQATKLLEKIPGAGGAVKEANQWIAGKASAAWNWAAAGIQGESGGSLNAPNKSATELQAGNTNVNIYSNGTEAKAEVTPRKGATINMNRLGYQP